MSALKPLDFQEATANRILELYQQKQYRVLLADEVGLGKTIIASAVIQKVADLHAAWDDHFKVVYICSNINIANQNCRKLGIPEEDCLDFQESRLSMQHLRIYESAGRDHSYMQLIPMTPATSFSMTGGQGSKHERALIYCRKIMHWNLPSNPIDLEQREGRINRYLCHAIRQNLADSEFGAFPFEKSVWKETMDRATVALKQNHSDLIPYWCLPDDFPFKYKIERIVPMYPYSQDRCRYDHLMDVLSVYRLTLGQPRQEELFETIHKENWNMDELKKLYINLSPWNRAHHNGGTEHED